MSNLLPMLGLALDFYQRNIQSRLQQGLSVYLMAGLFFCAVQVTAAEDKIGWEFEDEEPEIQLIYHQEELSGYFEELETREEDRQQDLELELAYPFQFNPYLRFNLDTSAVYERIREPGETRWKTEDYIELDELWLQWQPNLESSTRFRLGRQSIADPRGWWWDDNFDAVSHSHQNNNYSFLLSLGRLAETEIGLNQDDPEEDDLYWLMLRLGYQNSRLGSLAGYVTRLDDRSSSFVPDQVIEEQEVDDADATLNWIGIRYQNSWFTNSLGDLSVLIDLAYMKGSETQVEVEGDDEDEPAVVSELDKTDLQGRASHIEIGWRPVISGRFQLGALYASASADYRQTGIHSNEHDYQYYGTLYEPSLQNVEIAGVHASLDVMESGKLIIQFLDYSRPKLESDPGENAIDLDVEAESKDLGTELGLIYGQEIIDDLELEISFSQFESGKAYGDFSNRKFKRLEIELAYSF